jgi:HAE1 family hydrophobic/amphiphilic exporter-1
MGVFYKTIWFNLAVSIVLSAINALTLSPALCAIFLKPHEGAKKQDFRAFLYRFQRRV